MLRLTKNQNKKSTWIRIIGIIGLLLLIGTGVYIYNLYSSVSKAVETMHEPIERDTANQRQGNFTLVDNGEKQKGDKDQSRRPFSILLLGVDARPGDTGRSDTMIVMTVNPKLNSTKMVSIPRDTRTRIVGKGFEDKINHAYAFGGSKMAIETVENFLDIPIDYYVKVNMDGFKDIVNAVGGVSVKNKLSFSEGDQHFPKGKLSLDGKEALSYVRMRKTDPNGDFGRQQRQRQVIKGVITKGKSLSSITRYEEILNTLGENVKTNLTLKEMAVIQKDYRSASKDLQQIQLQGNAKIIGEIYYQLISQEELTRVQDKLKAHLEA